MTLLAKAGLALSLCVAVCVPYAGAAEWSAKSHINQTFEANDNLALEPDSGGASLGSSSALVLDILADLPTLHFQFGADINYQTHWGEEAPSSFDGAQGGAKFALQKAQKLTDYHFLVNWRRELASTSELLDSGRLGVDADRISYFTEGGLTHRLNHRNSLAWSTSGQWVDFTSTDDGLTPYTDVATTGSWIHHLSKRADVAASLGVEWYDADNPTETESMLWSFTGDLTTHLSRRLTFKGRAGVGVREQSEVNVNDATRPTDSETTSSFLADANLAYKLKNTGISITASNSYWPSSLGELQRRASVELNIDHQINELSSVLLTGLYSRHTDDASQLDDADRDVLVLSAAYAYKFAEDWESRLAYRFIQEDDVDGVASSNAVYFTIKRELTLLP